MELSVAMGVPQAMAASDAKTMPVAQIIAIVFMGAPLSTRVRLESIRLLPVS
jgi:hypothetical protein